MDHGLQFLDIGLFLFINGHHCPWLDVIMQLFSNKNFWIPLYALICTLLIVRYRLQSIYLFIAIVIILCISDQVSSSFFKPWVHRLRPCHNPELIPLIHLVNGCGGKYGFMSSHAANIFALLTFSWWTLDRWFRPLNYGILFCAFLVCYSRIYLGAHYPTDVFAGAIVGIIVGTIIAILYHTVISKRFIRRRKNLQKVISEED